MTNFREAVKTGLAFALVFGIALRLDWMNPYWAGWAVAVIALPTTGEAIRKGTLRVLGTLPGCAAALAIHALASQDRWAFILLTCAWAFGTSYMMVSRPRTSYFWVMACYVCLIILLSDLDSSSAMFQSAIFRTVETVMGVIVYTLIAVFLWPQTNHGAIKAAAGDLALSLREYLEVGREAMLGQTSPTAPQATEAKVTQCLARFEQALLAEGTESFEVSSLRHHWVRFRDVATRTAQTIGRWQSGLPELRRIDMRRLYPGLTDLFAEMDARMAALSSITSRPVEEQTLRRIRAGEDAAQLDSLSRFDRAAVMSTLAELEKLEQQTAELLACVHDLAAGGRPTSQPPRSDHQRITHLPVPDWEHLRSAFFVAATTGVGFLIWILFDPPGHSGWFQLSGTIALIVALCPQLRASRMILPVAITSLICLGIYTFIMPQLSSFLGLGVLLFSCMFLNCVLMTGMGRFFVSMAILNVIQIQNRQVYAFAAMANAVLFIVMAFMFLYVMSYLLGSSRPEKNVLRLLSRFFQTARFLLAHSPPVSLLDRWQFAFHLRQLTGMPAKIAAWGQAIDRRHFPATSPDQIRELVAAVQALVYRIEQFIEASAARPSAPLADELREDIAKWQTSLVSLFTQWAECPEAEKAAPLRARLDAALSHLEERLREAVNLRGNAQRTDGDELTLRVLGSYRGVSEAAVAYAGIAEVVDWAHWQEERFT